MKIKNNFNLSIVWIVMGVLALLYGCLHFGYYGDDWKRRTSPLSSATVRTLCENFSLDSNSLCSKKAVYGPDFYDIIEDTFRPYDTYGIDSSEAATYDEVEEKIGMFRYECGPVIQESDITYFRCSYDLRGDREFIIGIIYTYPDMAAYRINTPMGYDGE